MTAALSIVLSGSIPLAAGALQNHGVSVVGTNSLKYFWRTRTPAGVAADLKRFLQHYRIAWSADYGW